MPDALLMGGDHSGVELGLGGKAPPTLRYSGGASGVFIIYLPPLSTMGGDEGGYVDFDPPCYVRTAYTAIGPNHAGRMAIYEWRDA